MNEQMKLLAIWNQQVEVIRLEKLLILEMTDGLTLHECPSYPEYKKQMDKLEALL